MIKVIRAKLHAIRVTGSDLDYHGSITLDGRLSLLKSPTGQGIGLLTKRAADAS